MLVEDGPGNYFSAGGRGEGPLVAVEPGQVSREQRSQGVEVTGNNVITCEEN